MSWALRWSLVGAAIATVLHLWFDPPLGVVLAAVWVGYAIGVFVFCADKLFAALFGEKW